MPIRMLRIPNFGGNMMKLAILCALFTSISQAAVISPSSIEVRVSYTSEFQTKRTEPAADLILDHARYLFGYMQNPAIGLSFGLPKIVQGIGAPRWAPHFSVLEDSRAGAVRTIRYQLDGLLLMHKQAAEALLPRGEWEISLPYQIDNFYSEKCVAPDEAEPSAFWYFYEPFRRGCEDLRREPLARSVTLRLSPASPVGNLSAGLSQLRGDNGNGKLFQVMSINGFDESSTKKSDDGRSDYLKLNRWLVTQGFTQTVIAKYKNRPIHQFEKTFRDSEGQEILFRIVRLLADTDLDSGKTVTFAKFFRDALKNSDVVIYEGHSGMGTNLNLQDIEKRAGGPVEFDRQKKQLFFFDACSSYSYYLGMFRGKKAPGTLAVITNGLASLFDPDISISRQLYQVLFDFTAEPTWSEVLSEMERPLKRNTYLLNVDVNLTDEGELNRPMSLRW